MNCCNQRFISARDDPVMLLGRRGFMRIPTPPPSVLRSSRTLALARTPRPCFQSAAAPARVGSLQELLRCASAPWVTGCPRPRYHLILRALSRILSRLVACRTAPVEAMTDTLNAACTFWASHAIVQPQLRPQVSPRSPTERLPRYCPASDVTQLFSGFESRRLIGIFSHLTSPIPFVTASRPI